MLSLCAAKLKLLEKNALCMVTSEAAVITSTTVCCFGTVKESFLIRVKMRQRISERHKRRTLCLQFIT